MKIKTPCFALFPHQKKRQPTCDSKLITFPDFLHFKEGKTTTIFHTPTILMAAPAAWLPLSGGQVSWQSTYPEPQWLVQFSRPPLGKGGRNLSETVPCCGHLSSLVVRGQKNPLFWGVRVKVCCPQASPGRGSTCPHLRPVRASDGRNMAEGGL